MNARRIPKDLRRLEITLRIGCHLGCKYCPQEKLLKNYFFGEKNRPTELSFNNFVTCIDKIADGGFVVFNGMSEPFLNKECAAMVRYAYERSYKIAMATTLTGMTEQDLHAIKNVKFNNFTLHIPDEENNSKFIISEEYLHLLKLVHEFISITSYSCHGRLHPLVKDIISSKIELRSNLGNRAGNLDLKEFVPSNIKGKIICTCGATRTGWLPELLPDGRVVLCCNDYGMKHILGNLIKQNWIDILDGEEYRLLEKGMDDDTIDTLCRSCQCAVSRINIGYSCNLGMYFPNVIRIARTIEDVEKGIGPEQIGITFEKYTIIKMIVDAKNICVFGLGKFFNEDYYPNMWDTVIRANIFTDNDINKLDNTIINSGILVPPNDLPKYDRLVIIIFAASDRNIQKQLNSLGLHNYLNIMDLYKLYD